MYFTMSKVFLKKKCKKMLWKKDNIKKDFLIMDKNQSLEMLLESAYHVTFTYLYSSLHKLFSRNYINQYHLSLTIHTNYISSLLDTNINQDAICSRPKFVEHSKSYSKCLTLKYLHSLLGPGKCGEIQEQLQ